MNVYQIVKILIIAVFVNIIVYSQQPYVKLKTFTDHNASIECVVLSPDGKTFVTGDHSGYLMFWSIDSLSLIHKVKAHQGTITSILFNKSGSKIVTAGDDYKFKLWNAHTMKPIKGYTAPYKSVNFAVLSPNEKYIYFGGYTPNEGVYSSDQFTGLYRVRTTEDKPEFLFDDETGASLFSGTSNWGITDGNIDYSRKYIVFTKGYGLYFWDIDEHKLAFKKRSVYNLNNLTCTSKYIYTWGDGAISKYSVADNYANIKSVAGKEAEYENGYSKLSFSSNGSHFITGDDGYRMNIWNTNSMTKTQVIIGHKDKVRTFTYAKNDSIIIAGDYSGNLIVWGYASIKEEMDSIEKIKKNPVVIPIVKDTAQVPVVVIEEPKDTIIEIIPEIKDVLFSENNIPISIKDRKVERQTSLKVKSLEFEISIRDRGAVDGDIISLNLNGEWILNEYTVSKSPYKIKVKLNPNFTNNYLILYAHNLGEISPNTAQVSVVIDGKKYNLQLSSDLEKSGAINFEYTK